MANKKLNIEPALIEHAKLVLERDDIPYWQDGEGNLFAELDEEEEEILIEDAMCEDQRMRINSDIPVYSARTLFNEEKLNRLERLFWGGKPDEEIDTFGPFHVLEQDKEKLMF